MPFTHIFILILASLSLSLLFTLLYVSVRYKEELLSDKAFERFKANIRLFKVGVYIGIFLYLLFILEHGLEVVLVFFPSPSLERLEGVSHLLFTFLLLIAPIIALYLILKIRREDAP